MHTQKEMREAFATSDGLLTILKELSDEAAAVTGRPATISLIRSEGLYQLDAKIRSLLPKNHRLVIIYH